MAKDMEFGDKMVSVLKSGGVGVLPTDTVYGLVGLAFNKKAVNRVYKLKERGQGKPFIILIADIKDLELFSVDLEAGLKKILQQLWPKEISVILACPKIPDRLKYLKPLNNTLAFRMPKPLWLRKLIRQTGPLVAPSANPEGKPPATTIQEAKKYFGNGVDFYANRGKMSGLASTLVEVQGKRVIIRRQGAIKISRLRPL